MSVCAIYNIPESQMRPIVFGALDMPRYRLISLDAILNGDERLAAHAMWEQAMSEEAERARLEAERVVAEYQWQLWEEAEWVQQQQMAEVEECVVIG